MAVTAMTFRGGPRPFAASVIALLLVGVGLLLALQRIGGGAGPPPRPALVDFNRLPLAFTSASGAAGAEVAYEAHLPQGSLYFHPADVTLALPDATLSQQFIGVNPSAVVPGAQLPSVINDYQGADPVRWRTGLPAYANVTYRNLYPGVDLHYTGTNSHLKGTYSLAPGADPSRIRWRYSGATAVRVDAAGNLQISACRSAAPSAAPGSSPCRALDSGRTSLTDAAPVAWQEIDGRRVAVPARYVVGGDGSVGFGLSAYDRARPLTLDPTLTYATYYGGSSFDGARGVAMDAQGNVYVTGSTTSNDFPTVNPSLGRGGLNDAFVLKLDPAGTPVYATYLGGGSDDFGWGIAADLNGYAYVVGQTASPNFPVLNPYQAHHAPGSNGWDGFLSKLDPVGRLVYGTYLGGTGGDLAYGVAVDSTGSAYVAGSTNSTDFPRSNALQPAYGGGVGDGFLTKFSSDGASLVYSTYLGGSGDESVGGSTLVPGHGIALDAAKNVYLTGYSTSPNFPIANAIYPVGGLAGEPEAFTAKISADGAHLIFSTFLGTSNVSEGRGIALDANGNVYITGHAAGSFPLTHSVLKACHNDDAFVTKLNAAGTALLYSGCLGFGAGYGIGVDAAGNAYVGGVTGWSQFPQVNPLQAAGGGLDGFISVLNSDGSALIYSTFLGGSRNDVLDDLAVDASGNAVVVGDTYSTNFPVANPAQPANAGQNDSFVAKINPAPASTPGASPTPCPVQFSDVPAGSPFYPFVRCLACRGVLSGYSDGTFRPGTSVTRGQVAKIVTAAAGLTPAGCCTQTFADVPTTQPFYGWIQVAANQGLISGYACGSIPAEPCDAQHRPYFRPNASVTRGQLAKIVANAAGFSEAAVNQTFEDVPPAQTFSVYVARIAAREIISGYGCGAPPGGPCLPPANRPYFLPDAPVTRGQLAKIVANTFFPGCATPGGLH